MSAVILDGKATAAAVKADLAKRAEALKAKGITDFHAVRRLLLESGYQGWCTVEQDCDPAGHTSPVADARANRDYLSSIGFN